MNESSNNQKYSSIKIILSVLSLNVILYGIMGTVINNKFDFFNKNLIRISKSVEKLENKLNTLSEGTSSMKTDISWLKKEFNGRKLKEGVR